MLRSGICRKKCHLRTGVRHVVGAAFRELSGGGGGPSAPANVKEHPMMYSPRAQRFVPLTTKQISSALWNRSAIPYSTHIMPMFAPLHRIAAEKARELLAGVESPQVLDIGSAAGEPALSIAKALPESFVVSTDFSGHSMTGGRNRAARAGAKNMIFQFSDAEDLQFDDESFDLVTCCLVLSACDEEAVLHEIERILKPGGSVLLIEFDALANASYLRTVHASVAGRLLVCLFQRTCLICAYELAADMPQ